MRQDWESKQADPRVPGAVGDRGEGNLGGGGAASDEGKPVDDAGQ